LLASEENVSIERIFYVIKSKVTLYVLKDSSTIYITCYFFFLPDFKRRICIILARQPFVQENKI